MRCILFCFSLLLLLGSGCGSRRAVQSSSAVFSDSAAERVREESLRRHGERLRQEMLERIEVEFFPPAVFPDGGREAFSEAAPLAVKRISKSTLTAHSRNVELVDSTLRQEERGTLKREARSELSGRKRSGGACWLWIALALAALGGVWWIFRRFL